MVKAFCAVSFLALVVYLLATGDFSILDRDRF